MPSNSWLALAKKFGLPKDLTGITVKNGKVIHYTTKSDGSILIPNNALNPSDAQLSIEQDRTLHEDLNWDDFRGKALSQQEIQEIRRRMGY